MAYKQFNPGTPVFQFGGIKFGPQYQSYRNVPKYLTQNKNVYWVPTRITQMPRVDAQIMLDYFKQNMNFGFYTEYVARMMLRKFAEVAAKYSPPNIGKATIDEKYYYRPIYKLEDLAKGLCRTERGKRLYATKEDYAALRNGMKFKVMNTKHGVRRGTVYAYAKGINEAKRLSRIQNRGLTKYSWGSILNTFTTNSISKLNQPTSVGVLAESRKKGTYQLQRKVLIQTELPPIFRRLQKKSPNIVKYRWGTVNWQERDKGNKIDFTIINNLASVERYCEIAIRQGLNAAVREVNKLVKNIQVGAADKIEKMLAFDIFKVTKFTALTATRGGKKGRRAK